MTRQVAVGIRATEGRGRSSFPSPSQSAGRIVKEVDSQACGTKHQPQETNHTSLMKPSGGNGTGSMHAATVVGSAGGERAVKTGAVFEDGPCSHAPRWRVAVVVTAARSRLWAFSQFSAVLPDILCRLN